MDAEVNECEMKTIRLFSMYFGSRSSFRTAERCFLATTAWITTGGFDPSDTRKPYTAAWAGEAAFHLAVLECRSQ